MRLLHPATTIAEAITTLQRRFTNPRATAELAQLVQDGNLTIEPITDGIIAAALTRFRPQGSKQNTLFDAIVATVAKQQQAVAIFSFDHWYESQGFTLVTHLYLQKAA
jgi:predicted nucleic acid-binding protein